MSLGITGTIGNNLGAASGTIKLQMPLYPAKVRQALSKIHFGTINVQLDRPLIIKVEDYDLDTGPKRIKWHKSWVAERFLFKKCKFCVGDEEYSAWIYRSSSTPNSIDPYRVEVITKFIPNLTASTKKVSLKFEGARRISAVTF